MQVEYSHKYDDAWSAALAAAAGLRACDARETDGRMFGPR